MQNDREYPSQMPEGTTPGASNGSPVEGFTDVTTIREQPSGVRGPGAVGSGGARREPDMVATHGRDDFAEMPQRDDRSKGTPHSVNPRALGAPVTALLESR